MKVRIKGVRPYEHDGTFWKITWIVTGASGTVFQHTGEPIEGPRECAVRADRAILHRLWPASKLRVKRKVRARQFEQRFKKLGRRPFSNGG